MKQKHFITILQRFSEIFHLEVEKCFFFHSKMKTKVNYALQIIRK